MKFDSILATIGQTPHIRVSRLFPDHDVWIKSERSNPGGSIKDRIGLAMIEDAERSGALVALLGVGIEPQAQGAVVAIGETPGISIMVTALLRQLGMKRIVCRVLSPLQRTVLETMGIKEFAYPEADSAERMAYKLDLKGVVDSHKITDRFQLIEVEVPKLLIGSTIDQIDFARKYELTLITVIRPSTEKNIFGSLHVVRESLGLVKGELKLEHGDTLLLFGEVENLERFIEY